MTRRSVKPVYSMCVQPAFLIGTNNEDGSHNFAQVIGRRSGKHCQYCGKKIFMD